MGNKLNKAINLQHTIYKNNVELYIHAQENGYCYISKGTITHLSNTLDNVYEVKYSLPSDSIIKIVTFKVINGELQLLAKISSSHLYDEQMNNNWPLSNKNKLVNIISLFSLKPNSTLSPL